MLLKNIAANNTVTKELVGIIEGLSPLLSSHVHFYTKPGNSATSRKEQEGVGVRKRALDEDWTPITIKPEYQTTGRKIIGESAKLDIARESMGFDIASELSSQIRRIAPRLAVEFHRLLINGNSSANAKEFDGLKNLVQTGNVITPANATNGHQIKLGKGDAPEKSIQQFLEALDEAIAVTQGRNKVILCNSKMFARICSVARNWVSFSKNEFGVPVATYNMTPIVNMDVLGEAAILNNETKGTSKDCTSIYVASFEEEAGVSFLSTPDGFKAYDMERVGNFYQVTVQLIADSILLRDKALTRIQGIRL